MRMTVATVRARLARIDNERDDPEGAHTLQDDLFREVLTAIASGAMSMSSARLLASETLKVDEIPFERWMA